MSAGKPNRTFSSVPEGARALSQWTSFLSELFFEGEFEMTLIGCDTDPVATARYVASAGIVCLSIPDLSATSNSVLAFLSGLPEEITPQHDQPCIARVIDNGVTQMGLVLVGIDTGLTVYADLDGGAFTGSGTKGVKFTNLIYPLD